MFSSAGFSRRNVLWPVSVAATIFLASTRSVVASPTNMANFDKVAHFSVYALLATLVVRLGRGPRSIGWALLITSLYGVSDEWHQYFVPGRSCDAADWLADTLGGALGIALYRGWPWYRSWLEASIWPNRRVEIRPPVATVSPR
jgi:VanZ family protein